MAFLTVFILKNHLTQARKEQQQRGLYGFFYVYDSKFLILSRDVAKQQHTRLHVPHTCKADRRISWLAREPLFHPQDERGTYINLNMERMNLSWLFCLMHKIF